MRGGGRDIIIGRIPLKRMEMPISNLDYAIIYIPAVYTHT